MDEEELKNQIENYNTLVFFRSARKVATALMIFSAIITLIFVMVGWLSSETWIDIVLILILAFFVYKGKKWAMIVTMIYWTLSKGLQIVSGFSAEDFSGGNIIMLILWWTIFMEAFWQAYQVETARRKEKIKNRDTIKIQTTQKEVKNINKKRKNGHLFAQIIFGKFIKLSFLLTILLVSFSIFYYFVIFLPNKNKIELEQRLQERKKSYEACLEKCNVRYPTKLDLSAFDKPDYYTLYKTCEFECREKYAQPLFEISPKERDMFERVRLHKTK